MVARTLADVLEEFRRFEVLNPALYRFDESALPGRADDEPEAVWAARCLEHLADLQEEFRRRSMRLAVCRLAVIATVHMVNGDRHAA